jgi:hypothetical protein
MDEADVWITAKEGHVIDETDLQFLLFNELKFSTEMDRSWHITSNPQFSLDPNIRPQWNSTMGGEAEPGLFVTKDPEFWVNGHDYIRPFIAEIEHPAQGMERGYYSSADQFLPASLYSQSRIRRVMPIDEWVRETYHSPGWIESALDDIDQYHQFPKDYRYTGPDVRDMPPEETQRHLNRAARYIETVRPHMLRYYDPETDSMQQGEKWRWSRVKTAVPRWDYTELATHIFQEALGRGMDLNQAADYTMEQLTFEESMSREEMSHFIAPIVDKLLQFYKRLEEKDERGEIGDDSPYDVQWDDMIPDLPGLRLDEPKWGKAAGLTQRQKAEDVRMLDEMLGPSEAQVLHQFDNGYTVQRQPTFKDVYRTGLLMRNCWRRYTPDDTDTTAAYRDHKYTLNEPNGYPVAAFNYDPPQEFTWLRSPSDPLPAGTARIHNGLGHGNAALRPEYDQMIQEWADTLPHPVQWGYMKRAPLPDSVPGVVGDPVRAGFVHHSAWDDVMEKAQRYYYGGNVDMQVNNSNYVEGNVQGSQSSPYQTWFTRDDPNSGAITQWGCSCPWGAVSWGRTRQFKKFEGRPCAHLTALYWTSLKSQPTDQARIRRSSRFPEWKIWVVRLAEKCPPYPAAPICLKPPPSYSSPRPFNPLNKSMSNWRSPAR